MLIAPKLSFTIIAIHFIAYCLEGEYTEKIWEIVDDNDGGITYQYRRNPDTSLALDKTIPGTLRHVKTRHHFPGNQLHVDTCQFHSISPIVGSNGQVLTFLVKQNYSPVPDMFVLSMASGVEAMDNEIRSATDQRTSSHV